jgi:hypothetical protein
MQFWTIFRLNQFTNLICCALNDKKVCSFPYLFSLNRGPFCIYSPLPPHRGQPTYSEVPSQMAAYVRTGSPLQAGETAGIKPRTAGLQSDVASNEQLPLPRATTA